MRRDRDRIRDRLDLDRPEGIGGEPLSQERAGPIFTPSWLDPGDVRDWLAANTPASSDVVGIDRICVATEVHVERCRPDQWTAGDPDATPPVDPAYVPDALVYQGAVMFAARECRRRNNPSGTETFGDVGITFVARWDADIDRALRTGGYAMPGVG